MIGKYCEIGLPIALVLFAALIASAGLGYIQDIGAFIQSLPAGSLPGLGG